MVNLLARVTLRAHNLVADAELNSRSGADVRVAKFALDVPSVAASRPAPPRRQGLGGGYGGQDTP